MTVSVAYERKRIYGRSKSENLPQVAGFFFLLLELEQPIFPISFSKTWLGCLNSFCRNLTKQVSRFCCPFCRT